MEAQERLSCEEMFHEQALVQAHLDECSVCATEHALEAALDQAIREKLATIRVPPGLMSRIRRRLQYAGESGG